VNKFMETNKKIENAVVSGYKAIENGVVSGYKAIEEGVVGGYQKMEDKIVGAFSSTANTAAPEDPDMEAADATPAAPSILKSIENSVVSGYQAVEDTFVGGYKKIEDKFVGAFLTPDDPNDTDEAGEGGRDE